MERPYTKLVSVAFMDLKNRIKTARAVPKPKMSQMALADAIGAAGGSTVSAWELGTNEPTMETLDRIAKATGVSASWLKSGEGEMLPSRTKPLRRIRTWQDPADLPPDYMVLRRIESMLSAGPHGPSVDDIDEHELGASFRADYARRAGWSRETHYTMRVDGRSMEPTIQDRSPVVIATNDRAHIRSGSVYAIRLEPNAQPLLKRLDKLPGGRLRVRSDNPAPEFAPFEVIESEIEIIGRAVWTSSEL